MRNRTGFTPISKAVKGSKKGFTLIELVIAIGIIGVIGFVLTDILTQSLRTENKSNVVNQVKQNGQIALDKMSNEIRQSENVVCPVMSAGATEVTGDTLIIFKQGDYIRFKYLSPTDVANGYISIEYLSPADILCADVAPTGTPTPVPLVSPYAITDKDPKSGVSIIKDGASKIFTINKAAGYKNIVTIKFRAKQAVDAGTLPENTVGEEGVLFQTTVQVRGSKQE